MEAEIRKHTTLPIDVVSNPEFLKEGSAIDDFMKPDRVVIGTSSVEAAEIMRELYSPFVRTGNPILVMDVKSAEVTKYAANALLASRVTFMNEIANLCEKVGADVSHVRRGMGSDSRIGSSFPFSGRGLRRFVLSQGRAGFDSHRRGAWGLAGNHQSGRPGEYAAEEPHRAEDRSITSARKNGVKGRHFALWGLAFKPKTDDMREAPALP